MVSNRLKNADLKDIKCVFSVKKIINATILRGEGALLKNKET